MRITLGVPQEIRPLYPEDLTSFEEDLLLSNLHKLLTSPFLLSSLLLSTRAGKIVQRPEYQTLFDIYDFEHDRFKIIRGLGTTSMTEIAREVKQQWGHTLQVRYWGREQL